MHFRAGNSKHSTHDSPTQAALQNGTTRHAEAVADRPAGHARRHTVELLEIPLAPRPHADITQRKSVQTA